MGEAKRKVVIVPPTNRRKPLGRRKKRKIVKRSTRIPTITGLYKEAYDKGMTVHEYVNYLNAVNSKSQARRCSTYDTLLQKYDKKGSLIFKD